MSYSIIKRRGALSGMDPLTCVSRGGMPLPTPVPWGGVDIDCQLPGEPPQAAQCRSLGGMWYRELGLCIPGALPGLLPSFPTTPYAPAPPANPYDQAAAQVCTATGGRYEAGLCNYPQQGVTRTRSQLVDSEYEPPAGWTPPSGGCPQGQIGWPPVCVPVPSTLPSIPTAPACPQGQVWDVQSGKCLDKAQVLPPGEEPPQKQVAPAKAEEDKLPSWVIPAVAGGAVFVILAALVMRQPREMRANQAPSPKLHVAVARAKKAHDEARRLEKSGTLLQIGGAYSKAGRLWGDAADLAYDERLQPHADRYDNASLRCSELAAKFNRAAADEGHSGPYGMRPNPPVELTYADLNVFQRYWWGQWDPLYAVLSRRGNSVSRVTLEASEEELERLHDVAEEIVQKSDDSGEVRTAKAYLKRIGA
jgi:hypothetical protein